MKKLLMIVLFCAFVGSLKVQNTFPTPSGNVGIGTTTPIAPLQIHKQPNGTTVNEALRIVNLFNPNTDNNPSIIFTNNATDIDPLTTNYQSWALGASIAGAANLSISYKGSNPLITPFLINGNGNIGMGTATPGAALSISNSTPVLQIFDSRVIHMI